MKSLVVAKVVVVGPSGQVLLLRRSKDDVRRPNQYDIPGGHADGQEFANEAAARETKEEIGIDVDSRQLKLVYSEAMTFADEDLSVVWLFFVAHTASVDVVISHEHNEYQWADLDEAIKLIDYDRQKRALQYIADAGLLSA